MWPLLQEVLRPDKGKKISFPQPGFPIKFSGTPWRFDSSAPGIGEHNHQVLKQFGFSEEEITALAEDEII